MFVLNKIKFDADNKYDIYEKRISQYYYKDDNIERYRTNTLTEYIYTIFIQKYLRGVFYNTSISVCDVNIYIQNLYTAYYRYYIKNIINDKKDYIITKELIYKFVKNDAKLLKTTEWIFSKTDLNIPLDIFIQNVFKPVHGLSIFVRFGDNTTVNDIFIFLARLLDFIIENEIITVIVKMALGHLL